MYTTRMCGRFTLAAPEPTLREVIGPADWHVRPVARWNVAPGQDVLAVTGESGGRRVEAIRWGFPVPGGGAPLVNARVESAATSPRFRRAFVEGRCIVPADAFYEWQGRGGQPYRIAIRDGRVFGLAAIRGEAGGLAILTRDAVPGLARIHHRMPVVVEAGSAWSAWLGGAAGDALAVIVDSPPDLISHPVSRRVNSVLNDDAECAREAPPEGRQITLW